MVTVQSNFEFLEEFEGQAFRLGQLAERYFADEPNTCLLKLRQLAETTAKLTAGRFGLAISSTDSFSNVLRKLRHECSLPREVGDLFHGLRVVGNQAAHEGHGAHSDALHALKLARQLAAWYVRTFHDGRRMNTSTTLGRDVNRSILPEGPRTSRQVLSRQTAKARRPHVSRKHKVEHRTD